MAFVETCDVFSVYSMVESQDLAAQPLSTNHMLGLLNLLNLTECMARF